MPGTSGKLQALRSLISRGAGLSLCCACLSLAAGGQQYVADPAYLSSVEANQAVRSAAEQAHQQYLSRIRTDVDAINGNVGAVVIAQAILFNSLANVNAALNEGLMARQLPAITADMTACLKRCLLLAGKQPYLLTFTTSIQWEMAKRASLLLSDVSRFVLKGGTQIMADYSSRDELLRKIRQELQILDALAYGAWKAMYWASLRGWMTLNPFSGYAAQDQEILRQIIAHARYLHQN